MLYFDQLDLEGQHRIRWYDRGSAGSSIPHLRGNNKFPFPSDTHSIDADIPSLNHLARTQTECEGLPCVKGAVEFLSAA